MRLITIPISHYCEKARWALDRAGLRYEEDRHVQGVHRLVARRAGGGATVPVLVTTGRVLSESDEIVRFADRDLPEEERLYPAEPALRREVEELCHWLDEGLGPDGRRLMYAHMLPHRKEMHPVNSQGLPAWERRASRVFWPLLTRFGRRELGIGPNTIFDDTARVRRAFDAVAKRLGDGRRYLCGDRFTAADLTFAALSASVTVPPHYGVPLPQPQDLPEPVAGEVRSFRAHPAGAFALRMFHEERTPRVG